MSGQLDKEISRKEFTLCRVLLAKRNPPQCWYFCSWKSPKRCTLQRLTACLLTEPKSLDETDLGKHRWFNSRDLRKNKVPFILEDELKKLLCSNL